MMNVCCYCRYQYLDGDHRCKCGRNMTHAQVRASEEKATTLQAQIEKQNERIKGLREALEYYANNAFGMSVDDDMLENGYMVGMVKKEDREWCGKNQIGGKRARAALKWDDELKNEN